MVQRGGLEVWNNLMAQQWRRPPLWGWSRVQLRVRQCLVVVGDSLAVQPVPHRMGLRLAELDWWDDWVSASARQLREQAVPISDRSVVSYRELH